MMNYGMYPSYYQPMLNAQQRIQQYEQMMPQVVQQPTPQQQVQQQPVQTQNYSTIPVANMEEANAFRVDLSGTPTFFYNANKNEVYLKRTNTQTGAADFMVFAKAEQPLNEVKEEKSVITYEKDFKALNDKIDGFSTKIDGLYSLLNEKSQEVEQPITKGGKNAK